MFRTIASVIVACFAASASVSPAHAEQAGYKTVSIAVSYADLDIGSAAGAKTLLSRLTRASRHACGERHAPQPLRAAAEFQACVRTAMSDAVAQVGSATVSGHYAARGGMKIASR